MEPQPSSVTVGAGDVLVRRSAAKFRRQPALPCEDLGYEAATHPDCDCDLATGHALSLPLMPFRQVTPSSIAVPPEAIGGLASVEAVHVAGLWPEAVRGNHFHHRRSEVIA